MSNLRLKLLMFEGDVLERSQEDEVLLKAGQEKKPVILQMFLGVEGF